MKDLFVGDWVIEKGQFGDHSERMKIEKILTPYWAIARDMSGRSSQISLSNSVKVDAPIEQEGKLDAPTIEDRIKLLELKFEDLEAQVVRLTDEGLATITDKDIEWAKKVLEKAERR